MTAHDQFTLPRAVADFGLTGSDLAVELAPRQLAAAMDQIYGILLHVSGVHPAQGRAWRSSCWPGPPAGRRWCWSAG